MDAHAVWLTFAQLCGAWAVWRFFLQVHHHGFIKTVMSLVRAVPGVQGAVGSQVSKEAKTAVDQLFGDKDKSKKYLTIPKSGLGPDKVLEQMKTLRDGDLKGSDGNCFAYVYEVDHDHSELMKKASTLYLETNGLNPMAFPGLRKFENEIVRMSASMLNGGPDVVGNVSTGGTESILLAVKTYRDMIKATKPHILQPEVVACITVHPAFEKACHYFGLKLIYTPFDPVTYRAQPKLYEKEITNNTVLLLGSAPQYPHGVIDPIEEIAAMAKSKGIGCHVDACIGGFMLPWVRKLGYRLPPFDFAVDGVTSMSADLHKYGYTAKGASCVLYKDEGLRKHQFFSYSGWPGGLFISPTMLGTRGGASIAAAWAALVSLGEDGFMKQAKVAMDTTLALKEGIAAVPELSVLGSPNMTIIAFESQDKECDLLAVADHMEESGWKMERQQNPTCVHLTVMPAHAATYKKFLTDLKTSVAHVKKNQQLAEEGTAKMYGMIAKIPDNAIVEQFLTDFLGYVYRT